MGRNVRDPTRSGRGISGGTGSRATDGLDFDEEEETERAVDVILKEFAGEVAGAMPEKVVEHEQPKTTEAVVVPSVSKEEDERRPVVVDVQSRLDALRE